MSKRTVFQFREYLIGRVLLSRFCLWELVALQTIAAIAFGIDVFLGIPVSGMILVFVITLWASVRLREIPIVTYINPFTIGVACSLLITGVYMLGALFVNPWREVLIPTTVDDAVVTGIVAVIQGLGAGYIALAVISLFPKKDKNSEHLEWTPLTCGEKESVETEAPERDGLEKPDPRDTE
jgi:hypothetical protein